jgi:hypothetical protein
MRNGLLALRQLSPQSTPLYLGTVEDPSFDAVKNRPHTAEGVVVRQVELRWRVVALSDGGVAAIPPVLYFPFLRILFGARYPRREILEDHCLCVGVLLRHIAKFLGAYFRRNLLGAVDGVVHSGLHGDAIGYVGYGPRQIYLESGALDVVQGVLVSRGQRLEFVEQTLPFDLADGLLEIFEALEIPQSLADVQEVYMREEIGLVVVDGLLERPLLVGVVFHADNHVKNLCAVADMPAHTLLALQDETRISVGLVLRHQDNGLLEAVLGGRRGPGLVELCRSGVHKAHPVLT